MAAIRSTEFLKVDDYERAPNRHRSRSGGYADYLEQQTQWDRRDRERQMKIYHDRRHPSRSREPTDTLYVPTFDTHRRVRSQEQIIENNDQAARAYNVREVKPSTSYDLQVEPASSSRLPVRQAPKPQQRRPSIKVQIHQDDPPAPASSKITHKKSPSASASPRSPSAIPQLHFQFSTLQHKLAEIGTTCSPYIDVEAANPRDLTFGKISEQAKSFAFELEVWAHVVGLENMAMIDSRRRSIVEAASSTLNRLIDRAADLSEVCGKAKPKDLKAALMPPADDSDLEIGSGDGEFDESETEMDDVTESSAFVIQSHLDSIRIQIQTLKRLGRSLQEANPGAKDEMIAIGGLVAEVGKYFGSQQSLDQYWIDTRFAGRKALKEARYIAGN